MSEHDEQKTFFDWVRLNRQYASNLEVRKAMKLCYAVPNGAHMTTGQRGKMVGEGMTKGILDINLDMPVTVYEIGSSDPFVKEARKYVKEPSGVSNIIRKQRKKVTKLFAGFRIEMKYGKNTLSKEQKEKKELLEEAGFQVAICYSAKEAIQAVIDYLPFQLADYVGVKEFL